MEPKKKLLLFANYFYPEVASIAQIYTELCEAISDSFDITVICSVPCYTGKIEDKYLQKRFYYENYKSIKIIRVRVTRFKKEKKITRIKHILSYYINALAAVKKAGPQDIVFTVSQPPVLGGLLGVCAKRITGGKLIYNIQDFNPEQTRAVGYSKNNLIFGLMMFLDKRSCSKSDLVIVVGSDMKETLRKRFSGKQIPPNTIINNWTDEKLIYPLDKKSEGVVEFKKKYGIDNKFVIMYSGNIGLYYDLENLIEIFGEYGDQKDTVFAFVGEGAVKKKLEEICSDKNYRNIVFIPYQSKKDLIYSLNAADIHIVNNAKGIKGISVPSKLYGVMAADIPVLGILEDGSEASSVIKEAGNGVLADPDNYDEIREKINEIIIWKQEFIGSHRTGREYLLSHFTKERSTEKYRKAINGLLEERNVGNKKSFS